VCVPNYYFTYLICALIPEVIYSTVHVFSINIIILGVSASTRCCRFRNKITSAGKRKGKGGGRRGQDDMFSRAWLFILLFILSLLPTAWGSSEDECTYFVSFAEGNDSWTGTSPGDPFQSLHRAVDAIEALNPPLSSTQYVCVSGQLKGNRQELVSSHNW